MGLTVDEVRAAIEEILGPGGNINLDVQAGRVSGFIAHPTFSRYAVPDRRKMLWDRLRAHFGERASQIGILLLYSPEEYHEMAS